MRGLLSTVVPEIRVAGYEVAGIYYMAPADRSSEVMRTDRVSLLFCHLRLKAQKPKNPAHPPALNTLGDHLRAKRLDLGLPQKQVAEKIGVNEATVYNWENNRVEAAVRFIPRTIEFLGYCPYMPGSPLGERLKVCRQSLGYSQERMAELLGVDESTIASWERGSNGPTRKSLGVISVFFYSLQN